MTESFVDVPMLNDKQTASWHALLDLYEAHPTGWTLVGGQMVHLWCATDLDAEAASGTVTSLACTWKKSWSRTGRTASGSSSASAARTTARGSEDIEPTSHIASPAATITTR